MDQISIEQSVHIPRGKTIAVFIGASVALVMIGVFNLLADISPGIKKFLTLSKPVGPWSGKVLFGYLAGVVACGIALAFFRKHDGNIVPWFWVFVASLAVGTLLVFTPFLHALIGK